MPGKMTIAASEAGRRTDEVARGRMTKGSMVAMAMLMFRFDRSRTLRLPFDNAQLEVNSGLRPLHVLSFVDESEAGSANFTSAIELFSSTDVVGMSERPTEGVCGASRWPSA